jgi:hypothetical protein
LNYLKRLKKYIHIWSSICSVFVTINLFDRKTLLHVISVAKFHISLVGDMGVGGIGGEARGEGYINVVISPDISAATCYYRCKYSLFNYMALW